MKQNYVNIYSFYFIIQDIVELKIICLFCFKKAQLLHWVTCFSLSLAEDCRSGFTFVFYDFKRWWKSRIEFQWWVVPFSVNGGVVFLADVAVVMGRRRRSSEVVASRLRTLGVASEILSVHPSFQTLRWRRKLVMILVGFVVLARRLTVAPPELWWRSRSLYPVGSFEPLSLGSAVICINLARIEGVSTRGVWEIRIGKSWDSPGSDRLLGRDLSPSNRVVGVTNFLGDL